MLVCQAIVRTAVSANSPCLLHSIPASRTAIPFPPLKRWRSWLVLSKSRSINSSTRAKRLLKCQVCSNRSPQKKAAGAAQEKTPGISASCVACWASQTRMIASSCSTWRREWSVARFTIFRENSCSQAIRVSYGPVRGARGQISGRQARNRAAKRWATQDVFKA